MSPTLAEEVTPQNDGSVIIDGTANVREINKAFNWHLPEDDARTVNGVILEALEEIPVAGTRVRIGEYDIDTVSYTHLDVYKRQDPNHGSQIGLDRANTCPYGWTHR